MNTAVYCIQRGTSWSIPWAVRLAGDMSLQMGTGSENVIVPELHRRPGSTANKNNTISPSL
jgi:hypothetical protein